jgi:hypothetical protein
MRDARLARGAGRSVDCDLRSASVAGLAVEKIWASTQKTKLRHYSLTGSGLIWISGRAWRNRSRSWIGLIGRDWGWSGDWRIYELNRGVLRAHDELLVKLRNELHAYKYIGCSGFQGNEPDFFDPIYLDHSPTRKADMSTAISKCDVHRTGRVSAPRGKLTASAGTKIR